jgi:transcriptional regulator with XRE-family HTH domain
MNRIRGFGAAVKDLRLQRGMTQELLAEKADLHVNFVSLIERGLTSPALDTICLIADALEISVSELALQMDEE